MSFTLSPSTKVRMHQPLSYYSIDCSHWPLLPPTPSFATYFRRFQKHLQDIKRGISGIGEKAGGNGQDKFAMGARVRGSLPTVARSGQPRNSGGDIAPSVVAEGEGGTSIVDSSK